MKKAKGPVLFENTPPSWCGMSADDRVVVTLAPKSGSSRIVRWDPKTGARGSIGIVKENCETGAVSPTGERVAAVGSHLWLFDEKGTLLVKAPAWPKDDVNASSVAFSPDGTVIAAVTESASYSAPIVAWNVSDGKEILRAELAPMIVGERRKIGGRRIGFSPEGNRVGNRSAPWPIDRMTDPQPLLM
ncbi:MAG: hypothetical protein Q8O67_21655 [Deltaproteobacteria bacterium]|nr:hypothetical protein [Deltaproteobacteria bacterium]